MTYVGVRVTSTPVRRTAYHAPNAGYDPFSTRLHQGAIRPERHRKQL